MMTVTALNLAARPVLLRAANRIVETGLAHNDYTTPALNPDPDTWPVDPMGAIADACGLPARAWEDDRMHHPALVHACEAADLLVTHLGLDPAKAYDETLGAWSDEHTVEHVVTAMRNAAREETTS
ncbi:hypothetical protein ACIBQX_18930 [Nonomuraea sp. NPDC049714]|uniref:DUF6197 family protein n=1 Tax=Nonomuraea sp. NPDC049714 TaxID=3364357 RepID=UPI00379B5BD8